MIFSTFPCDWNYYGSAKLLVGEASTNIIVSINITFEVQTEIVVKVFWENLEEEKTRLLPFFDAHQLQYIHVGENHSLVLEGYINRPWSSKSDTFQTIYIITNRKVTQNSVPNLEFGKSIRVRAYLNQAVSFWDDKFWKDKAKWFNQEFRGIPKRFEEEDELKYIRGTSDYEFCCGISHIKHRINKLASNRSLESFYELLFFEVKNEQSYLSKKVIDDVSTELNIMNSVVHHICNYLGIRASKEIEPIFREYHIKNVIFSSQGFIIPVFTKSSLNKKSYFYSSDSSLHTKDLIESIIECEPLPEKIERGLSALYLTTYQIPSELMLMTSFSAIEFFYSYWFLDLQGYKKLQQLRQLSSFQSESSKYRKSLEKITAKISNNISRYSSGEGQTPSISLVMPFFLEMLDIDSSWYGVKFEKTDFIQLRNDLLHGGTIQDEKEIYVLSKKVRLISEEILVSLLKEISISTKKEDLYRFKRQSIVDDSFSVPFFNPTICQIITKNS